MEKLKKLDAAGERPWVLLSAGVDYPDSKKQVELAMKCGASGVLGGRAFWKYSFQKDGFEARDQFLRSDCVKRVKEVDTIVRENARP
jgi:tagatose 1,6-diphosphate aldolase